MAILHSGKLHAHAIRLEPGQDLVPHLLLAACQAQKRTSSTKSATILTAVGSLSAVTLRMAGASADRDPLEHIKKWENETMEIVSLVGTISKDGEGKHLHMSLSRWDGTTIGGHLIDGTVATTVELVLGTIEGVTFDRCKDEHTGYLELVVNCNESTDNSEVQRAEKGELQKR